MIMKEGKISNLEIFKSYVLLLNVLVQKEKENIILF